MAALSGAGQVYCNGQPVSTHSNPGKAETPKKLAQAISFIQWRPNASKFGLDSRHCGLLLIQKSSFPCTTLNKNSWATEKSMDGFFP